MLSSALALLLMVTAASQQTDPAAPARKAYSACLNDVIRSNLATKANPAKFDENVSVACPEAREALKTAVFSTEKAAGANDAQAEQAASDEVQDHLDNARILYRDYFETGARPEPND